MGYSSFDVVYNHSIDWNNAFEVRNQTIGGANPTT